MRRRLQLLVASVGLLGAAAVFHAPLLRALAPQSACPVEAPTLDSLERTRERVLPALRGREHAPSHSALGFELGRTTAAQAERPGCMWEVPAALLRCPEAQGSLVARFDRNGVLVGLDRRDGLRTPEEAARVFAERQRGYESQFGAPHGRGGEATATYLSSSLSQAGVRYRFDDLAVDLTATHLGQGVIVREQIRELPPGKPGPTGHAGG